MKRQRIELYMLSALIFAITIFLYTTDRSVLTLRVFFLFWSIIFLFILISHWYSIYQKNEIIAYIYCIDMSFEKHVSGEEILNQNNLIGLYVDISNSIENLFDFKENVNFLAVEDDAIDVMYCFLEDKGASIWDEIERNIKQEDIEEANYEDDISELETDKKKKNKSKNKVKEKEKNKIKKRKRNKKKRSNKSKKK